MQVSSSGIKLGCAIVSSSCLAAVIIGFSGASASATQFITIESTGTLSGTIELPRNNPNFNNSITRIDTDETGTYYRNLGTNNNPNYVPVYQSDYLQVRTRSDGSLHYFVDFKGIPFVSFDGVLTSPILSGGQLTPYKYQGQLPGTKFQGVVQDEFNFIKALYTGTVIDPDSGKQYQGTFEVSGYGERYSDRNGSLTPTVFDFQSDIPGLPTVTSLAITNVPLASLRIKVPIIETSIPEPTSVFGTLIVAGFGILLKRRKDISSKRMFGKS
ncbi:PEP-CTERM sorting domain-containing protein [Nostoc sp. CHAB 5824]|nr:PEP-CTERM sorting domain-containing protein [Nostoc sp. CHAB 5824]